MYIVISYDIKDDKRRTKIHKALKNYGAWVQYSVFECHLSEQEYRALRRRLEPLIQIEEADSIRFYGLCGACHALIEQLGRQASGEDASLIFRYLFATIFLDSHLRAVYMYFMNRSVTEIVKKRISGDRSCETGNFSQH